MSWVNQKSERELSEQHDGTFVFPSLREGVKLDQNGAPKIRVAERKLLSDLGKRK